MKTGKIGEIINIKKAELPENVKEQDVLTLKNNQYEIDTEKREEIEERINSKLENLFED